MSTFQVSILASDHIFYKGPCDSLVIPTPQGRMGILGHHSNMIATLEPGVLEYRIPGEEVAFAAVSAGMIKVESNEVLILVDTAEKPEEIDANLAQRALDEAREAMYQKKSIQTYRLAQAGLAREINRLRVKNRHHSIQK